MYLSFTVSFQTSLCGLRVFTKTNKQCFTNQLNSSQSRQALLEYWISTGTNTNGTNF